MDNALAQVPLFQAVPRRELRAVGPQCELRRYRRGEEIFIEGQPATSVWVVKRGWVYLIKRTPQGEAVTIFTMTPDEALCGVSAFDHGTYSAGAIAATDTQLIRIPAVAFAQLLERHPGFAQQVLLVCCHRIRHMAESISLAQAPVERRVIHTLLRLRVSFGNTLPITHRELARMTATRLETSIRTIATLRRRGWLANSRGRMTILKPEQLKTALTALGVPSHAGDGRQQVGHGI